MTSAWQLKKSITERRSRLLGLGATSPGGTYLLKKRNCEPTARNEWTRYLALIISRTKLVANTTQRCVTGEGEKVWAGASSKGWVWVWDGFLTDHICL